MNHVNYFRYVFESIDDCRKIVFLMFLFKNDIDLLTECGFLKVDNNHLCTNFKNILQEQNEEYLAYMKNQEESFIEKISNK